MIPHWEVEELNVEYGAMVPTGENRSIRSKCHVVSHKVQSM